MKTVKLASIIILLTFVSISAQPGLGKGMQCLKHGPTAKLNLTPEQEKQFMDINLEHQKIMVDLKAQVEKNQIEIKKVMAEKNIDEKKLFDLTDANSKLQAQMKNSAVKKWLDVYKILDDEQKIIWKKHAVMLQARMKGLENCIKAKIGEKMRSPRKMLRYFNQ
jgi:Spy/CpxP family protein refolding chaperone